VKKTIVGILALSALNAFALENEQVLESALKEYIGYPTSKPAKAVAGKMKGLNFQCTRFFPDKSWQPQDTLKISNIVKLYPADANPVAMFDTSLTDWPKFFGAGATFGYLSLGEKGLSQVFEHSQFGYSLMTLRLSPDRRRLIGIGHAGKRNGSVVQMVESVSLENWKDQMTVAYICNSRP
jgi:hypothetical protein